MVTEQPFVWPGSCRPWQHHEFAIPLVNPSLDRRICANVNGFGDDVSLGSVSDSCVGVILERVISPRIVGDRIG